MFTTHDWNDFSCFITVKNRGDWPKQKDKKESKAMTRNSMMTRPVVSRCPSSSQYRLPISPFIVLSRLKCPISPPRFHPKQYLEQKPRSQLCVTALPSPLPGSVSVGLAGEGLLRTLALHNRQSHGLYGLHLGSSPKLKALESRICVLGSRIQDRERAIIALKPNLCVASL